MGVWTRLPLNFARSKTTNTSKIMLCKMQWLVILCQLDGMWYKYMSLEKSRRTRRDKRVELINVATKLNWGRLRCMGQGFWDFVWRKWEPKRKHGKSCKWLDGIGAPRPKSRFPSVYCFNREALAWAWLECHCRRKEKGFLPEKTFSSQLSTF